MTKRDGDPRSIITPDSFVVAPDLLGLPLASPSRRAVAMVCDMIPLGILISAHATVLAVAAAAMLWRASTPSRRTGPVRAGVRGLLRVGAAILGFMIVLRIGGAVFDRDGDDGDDEDAGRDVASSVNVNLADDLPLELRDVARIQDVLGLVQADDEEAAARYARSMGEWLAGKDVAPERRHALAADLLDDIEDASLRPAAESAFASVLGPLPRRPAGDSAILAYASALERGDTVATAGLRSAAADALAAEQVTSLQRRNAELTEERDDLREELSDADSGGGGIVGFVRSIGDDLGIGFGWGAVYFTSFLALWGGYTPGKRLLGIRVIRLDGKPMGWWRSFERFGGYAASLSTGLLGFLQILWDRNRQGLHDKAVETVVIRVGAPRAPLAARPATESPSQ
jgi:hypothetical protein